MSITHSSKRILCYFLENIYATLPIIYTSFIVTFVIDISISHLQIFKFNI